MVDGARPVRQAPNRPPHPYRELVKTKLKITEEKGTIMESKSEWVSPIVLVGKKDGSMRMCMDIRHLNEVTRVV